jgi:acyl-CoA synthetase (NDP forming)
LLGEFPSAYMFRKWNILCFPSVGNQKECVEEMGLVNTGMGTYMQTWFEGLAADTAGRDEIRLNEYEMYGLMQAAGLKPSPAIFLPGNADEKTREAWVQQVLEMAGNDERFILKVVGRDILHKTDVGGVKIVNLAGLGVSGILNAVNQMKTTMSDGGLTDSVEGYLAASFVPHKANTPGQEVLLSLKQDPAFGPCVVMGIGGTLTEWYGKGSAGNSTLILPATGLVPEIVGNAIESHPLLSILCFPSRLYREAPVALDILVSWVMALAKIGLQYGPQGESEITFEEIEINPAVASGGELVALDGVGLVSFRKWSSQTRPVEKIHPLLKPKSAMVLGVSAKGLNPGRIILENLKRSEGIDQKRLYVVHHKEESISGIPCFGSVKEVPEKCDLAVISVPAQGALDTITELVEQDMAQALILIPGGFAEAGEADLAKSIEDVLSKGHCGENGGPVMVGGNCLGIVSRDNYNTFFLPDYKLPFSPGLGKNLALVSQSGAYLVTFASNYDGIINPNASISFGNQMDLTISDFVEHFSKVDEVNVIACYVEGFRAGDGVRFLEMAKRAKKAGKRVIIFKAGKTALGAQAAASHTASLAGDYAVAKACLLSAGITVAESLDQFEDLIKTFTLLAEKPIQGKRVGIISNAGFECSTVMDKLAGLELATFDSVTQAVLDETLPSFAHRTNPIDCTPMTGTRAFVDSCGAILDSSTVDLAILASVPVTPALDNLPADSAGRHQEDLSGGRSQPKLMIDIIHSSTKPAVVVVDSGKIYDPMCRMIEESGVPVFRKIDRAAQTMAAFCRS